MHKHRGEKNRRNECSLWAHNHWVLHLQKNSSACRWVTYVMPFCTKMHASLSCPSLLYICISCPSLYICIPPAFKTSHRRSYKTSHISLSLSLSLYIYIYIYIYIYVFLPSKRAVKELREPDTKTAICYVQHDLIEITCKSSKLGRSGQPSFAHNCTVPDGSWAAHTHTHSHTHTHTHTHRWPDYMHERISTNESQCHDPEGQ